VRGDGVESIPMVHMGGDSTMLGQWRVIVRQAEEAGRAGRFEEALALVSRADVADFRQAVQLRARLGGELIARAGRRGLSDDVEGALADLGLAERHGAPPDTLATARLALAEHVAGELEGLLAAGEPGRVAERTEGLAKHRVSGPRLRRLGEAADAWQTALAEFRRGEFGAAREGLDRAGRLGGDALTPALAAVRRELETRQQAVLPRIERLYAALQDGGGGGETLAAAEAVLELVPDHPAARQARTQAWQQVGSLSPAASMPRRSGTSPDPGILFLPTSGGAGLPGPAAPARAGVIANANATAARPAGPAPAAASQARPGPGGAAAAAPGERFLFWVDAVGGYLVLLGDEILLGRAAPDGTADVPLLGDLSRRHATLTRSGETYVLRAHHPTFLNNRRVETATLRDGDVIRLGPSVELEFHQPSPVSSTARLDVVSRHRLPVAVDGILLMAETCIMGPGRQAHVPAPNLDRPVVLYRQGESLWCKAHGPFEVDGRARAGRAGLSPRSSVVGEGFSFSLEPLASRVNLS
jgi:hypothetical protein